MEKPKTLFQIIDGRYEAAKADIVATMCRNARSAQRRYDLKKAKLKHGPDYVPKTNNIRWEKKIHELDVEQQYVLKGIREVMRFLNDPILTFAGIVDFDKLKELIGTDGTEIDERNEANAKGTFSDEFEE